jgi:hypothetical protein
VLPSAAASQQPRSALRRKKSKNGPFDPAVLGMAAHDVIGCLASDGAATVDFERITSVVRAHAATQLPGVHRQAARQWLMSTACLYFRLFGLPAEWNLLGTELRGPSCVFDLVWRNESTGRVLVDELKTGKAADLIGGEQLDTQLDRQRADGVALYGERFEGIRLLILAAPRRSFLVAPDGARSPLYVEDPS